MKRFVLYSILLIIVSCQNKKVPELNDPQLLMPSTFKLDVMTKDYSTESLIEEKFKEFYDLNILLRDYPDFKESIENRIDNFSSGGRRIFEINDSIKVFNIRQKGSLVKISDSIQMTHVLFDIISEKEIKTDSVLAFVTKKKILIDNEEVTSTKVKFTRVVIQKFN